MACSSFLFAEYFLICDDLVVGNGCEVCVDSLV